MPNIDYILYLIHEEGRVDEFNAFAEQSAAPVLVSLYRYYTECMDVPF